MRRRRRRRAAAAARPATDAATRQRAELLHRHAELAGGKTEQQLAGPPHGHAGVADGGAKAQSVGRRHEPLRQLCGRRHGAEHARPLAVFDGLADEREPVIGHGHAGGEQLGMEADAHPDLEPQQHLVVQAALRRQGQLEDPLQALRAVGGLLVKLFDAGVGLLHGPLQGGEQDVVLGAVVMPHHRAGDAGLASDVRDARRGEAAGGEGATRCRPDGVARPRRTRGREAVVGAAGAARGARVLPQPLEESGVGAAAGARRRERALDAQGGLVVHPQPTGERLRRRRHVIVTKKHRRREPGGDAQSRLLHERAGRGVHVATAGVARVGAPPADAVEAAHRAALSADCARAVRRVQTRPEPLQAGRLVAEGLEHRDAPRGLRIVGFGHLGRPPRSATWLIVRTRADPCLQWLCVVRA